MIIVHYLIYSFDDFRGTGFDEVPLFFFYWVSEKSFLTRRTTPPTL